MSNPKLIFGTGLSSVKDQEGLNAVCLTAIENGITAFDTAPSYKTEKALGIAIRNACMKYSISREKIYIQTKIDPTQMFLGRRGIKTHFSEVLKELDVEYIDGLLIHWPIPEYFDETWETMIELKNRGLVKELGVSNVRTRQLKHLLNGGYVLDMIQIERNPLRTCFEEVQMCIESGIYVQAYSPLCKMHSDIRDDSLLFEMSKKYNREIGELVLRWHVDTNVSPVFTSKNLERIKQYSRIFNFHLENDDIDIISAMNKNYKMYLESWACPGY